MDKIKINPFVSAHHGKQRGILSKSVLLFMENKKDGGLQIQPKHKNKEL